MNVNTRSTRECAFGDLRPELVTAIRKHFEKLNLGDIESTIQSCFETATISKKSGLFANGNKSSVTGMLITSQLLVWASESKNEKPVVISAHLRNIDVHDFENTAMFQVNPDNGINISGRYTDVTKQGQFFVGVGADSAGEKFRQVLQHAIQKAQI